MRKKHHAVDYLKTEFWFKEAAKYLGSADVPKTPYWFAQNFNKDSPLSPETVKRNWLEGVQYSGHKKFDKSGWEKRKKGTAVPEIRDGYHPVLQVGKAFPELSDNFYSIFWRVLKHENVQLSEIEDWLQAQGMKLGFRYNPEGKMDTRSGTGSKGYETLCADFSFFGPLQIDDAFWRDGDGGDFTIHELMQGFSERPVFDRLKINVVLLAWASGKTNHSFWNDLCDYYHSLIPYVVLEDDISVRFKILNGVDSYAMKRKFVGLNKMVPIELSWTKQDLGPTLFDHYYFNFVFHPLFFNTVKTEDFRRDFAETLTEIVCLKEALWKRAKNLWWPAGFIIFDYLKGEEPRLKKLRFENEKPIITKLTQGLESYISDPKLFESRFEVV